MNRGVLRGIRGGTGVSAAIGSRIIWTKIIIGDEVMNESENCKAGRFLGTPDRADFVIEIRNDIEEGNSRTNRRITWSCLRLLSDR